MIHWKDATKSNLRLLKAICIVFRKHPKLLSFLFDPHSPVLRAQPEALMKESRDFSSGEDLLVRVALDMWSGSGEAYVYELIEILDNTNLFNVLEGLQFLKAKSEGWEGPVYSQLKTDSDNLRRQLKLDNES